MRPTWDETWLAVADVIARRSFCIRKYGAVIVGESGRIVSTGYNGPPANWAAISSVDERFIGCGDCREYCPHARLQAGEPVGYLDCFSIHAEANSLMHVDRTACEGGTIYITTLPCWHCAKMIANSGLVTVTFRQDGSADYRGREQILEMLDCSGLEVVEA